MSMTPEARARDIMDQACLPVRLVENGLDAALRRDITSAIKAAETEARERALEEAAKIAESAPQELLWAQSRAKAAEAIRSLKSGEGRDE